ncbi:hypothetical protein [uncultured Mediterranean phage uvMED]|nr:hypothetical protein [uncultured Mediterranean phage uvMED]
MNGTQRIVKEILSDGNYYKFHYNNLSVSETTFTKWRKGISEPRGQLKTRLENYYKKWKKKH